VARVPSYIHVNNWALNCIMLQALLLPYIIYTVHSSTHEVPCFLHQNKVNRKVEIELCHTCGHQQICWGLNQILNLCKKNVNVSAACLGRNKEVSFSNNNSGSALAGKWNTKIWIYQQNLKGKEIQKQTSWVSAQGCHTNRVTVCSLKNDEMYGNTETFLILKVKYCMGHLHFSDLTFIVMFCHHCASKWRHYISYYVQ